MILPRTDAGDAPLGHGSSCICCARRAHAQMETPGPDQHAQRETCAAQTNLVLACVPAKKVKPGRNHFDAAELGAHHKPRHVAVQLSSCRFTERV